MAKGKKKAHQTKSRTTVKAQKQNKGGKQHHQNQSSQLQKDLFQHVLPSYDFAASAALVILIAILLNVLPRTHITFSGKKEIVDDTHGNVELIEWIIQEGGYIRFPE